MRADRRDFVVQDHTGEAHSGHQGKSLPCHRKDIRLSSYFAMFLVKLDALIQSQSTALRPQKAPVEYPING